MLSQKRHVVVSGGGGFIGKALCRDLLARGYRVTVLTRGKTRPIPHGLDDEFPAYASWDGRTAESWGTLADGAFALVNLAGEGIAEGRWTPQRKRSILQSRVDSGRAMADAVKNASVKPGVFIQASAVGYYGDTGDAPVDESWPSGRGFLAEVCRQWEASTLELEGLGVRRVVVRTGLVLGHGGVLAKMLPVFRLFLGAQLGNGKQFFPWIHIDDQVRAMVSLLENPQASGPFNLSSPGAVSNLEFCRVLGRVLSRPCGLAVPGAFLRLAMGEMADELLLSGCRALPRRLAELGFTFVYPGLAEALKDILA